MYTSNNQYDDYFSIKDLMDDANEYRETGYYQNAIELYSEVLRRQRVHNSARLYRGQCYARLEKYSDAFHDYAAAMNIKDNKFYKMNKLESCINNLREKLSRLANEAFEKEDFQTAASYYELLTNYTNQTNRLAKYHYYCGQSYLKLRKINLALTHFDSVANYGADNFDFLTDISFQFKKIILSEKNRNKQKYLLECYDSFLNDLQENWSDEPWWQDDIRWCDLAFDANSSSRDVSMNLQKHYTYAETGRITFRDMVLKWTLADIMQIDKLKQLNKKYQTANQYYDAMLPLVIEEAKASMRQHLENAQTFPLTILRAEKRNNPNVPYKLVTKSIPQKYLKDTQNGIALWLQFTLKDHAQLECLSMGNAIDANDDTKQMQMHVLIDEEVLNNILSLKAIYLGSLTTYQRMFTVCYEKPASQIITQISTGELLDWSANMPSKSEQKSSEADQMLDFVQQSAADNLLMFPENYLYLLQGPPGTGKTTTIVELLKKCITENLRILVSAPSNKAMQEIATRLFRQSPTTKMMLAGVKEKLPSELLPIFVHEWHKRFTDEATKLIEIFLSFETTVVNGNPRYLSLNKQNLQHEISELFQKTFFVLNQLLKYHPECLEDFKQIEQLLHEHENRWFEHIEAIEQKNNSLITHKNKIQDQLPQNLQSIFNTTLKQNYFAALRQQITNFIDLYKTALAQQPTIEALKDKIIELHHGLIADDNQLYNYIIEYSKHMPECKITTFQKNISKNMRALKESLKSYSISLIEEVTAAEKKESASLSITNLIRQIEPTTPSELMPLFKQAWIRSLKKQLGNIIKNFIHAISQEMPNIHQIFDTLISFSNQLELTLSALHQHSTDIITTKQNMLTLIMRINMILLKQALELNYKHTVPGLNELLTAYAPHTISQSFLTPLKTVWIYHASKQLKQFITDFIHPESSDFDISITQEMLTQKHSTFLHCIDDIMQKMIPQEDSLNQIFENLQKLLKTYHVVWHKKILEEEKRLDRLKSKNQSWFGYFSGTLSEATQLITNIPSWILTPTKTSLLEKIDGCFQELWSKIPDNDVIETHSLISNKEQLSHLYVSTLSIKNMPIADQSNQIHCHFRKLVVSFLKTLSAIRQTMKNQINLSIEKLNDQFFDTVNDELMLLEKAQIVFSSLSVCGRQNMQRLQGKFDMTIIDEAGQAIQAETMIPLSYATKKALLVGDHMQLPPTTFSETTSQTKFEESILARLILNGAPHRMLTIQYRMHPEIRDFPSRRFYNELLQDAASISTRENPLAIIHEIIALPYGFINIANGQEKQQGHSFYNSAECLAIQMLIKRITQIKPNLQIGVITFYRAQLDKLKSTLTSYKNVLVATVDGFQGGECDCVMISCVRANPAGNVGFAKDFRRINVALTRGRHGLITFGHATTLKKGKHVLSDFIKDAQERQKIFSAQQFGLFKEEEETKTSEHQLQQPKKLKKSHSYS